MNKISAVYRITNTITGDFYIGSSKDVKRRFAEHKYSSSWNRQPNNPLYQDMQKLGVDKFVFEILEEVEVEKLKEVEQQFIEALKPTYNNYNAKGLNVERIKEYQKSDKYKEYQKSEKRKKSHRKANNKYYKTDKGKETQRKASNKYNNQLCCYNGETLTLNALSTRFLRQGIEHPVLEAKKYLIGGNDD